MSEKPKPQEFYVQDPFTEEVKGPLSASDLKQWFLKGGFEEWGVSRTPNGPWTLASQVKGLLPAPSLVTPTDQAQPNTATSTTSSNSGGPVRSSSMTQNTPANSAFGGVLNGPPSEHAGQQAWLSRNVFSLVIVAGCLLLVAGITSDNPVIGGLGFWAAIGGVVLPRLRSRFPKLFAGATPLSIGAILALIAGALVLLGSMAADTTVDTGTAIGRVHNIGLMNQQRNGITIGAVLMAAGAVMGGLHIFKNGGSGSASSDGGNKACPKCGETIKRVAVFCKHCKSDIG